MPTGLSDPETRFIRREQTDRSQQIRHTVQGAFLLLNGWIGLQFFLWVRGFEGASLKVSRPAGVEGWLPIAGMMNSRLWLLSGHVPAVHPAAMFLFLAFVAMSLLLKKSFCAWLCPVGTVSEALWKLGRHFYGRNLRLPRPLDLTLRSLKYLLLALFVGVIGSMSAEALDEFLHTPYGLVADVKMLNFFRNMSLTAGIVIVLLVVGSLLVQNLWCRYLCPYGALMGLVSLLSPAKIRRAESSCIDCGKCAKACPAALPVDKLVQIRSVECAACMECIAACPAQDALQFALPRRKTITPAQLAAALAVLFCGTVLIARATGHWQTELPRAMYQQLIPRIGELSHPGM